MLDQAWYLCPCCEDIRSLPVVSYVNKYWVEVCDESGIVGPAQAFGDLIAIGPTAPSEEQIDVYLEERCKAAYSV